MRRAARGSPRFSGRRRLATSPTRRSRPFRRASIRTLSSLLERLVHFEVRQPWSCKLAHALEELAPKRSDRDWAVVREGSSSRADLRVGLLQVEEKPRVVRETQIEREVAPADQRERRMRWCSEWKGRREGCLPVAHVLAAPASAGRKNDARITSTERSLPEARCKRRDRRTRWPRRVGADAKRLAVRVELGMCGGRDSCIRRRAGVAEQQ